VAAASVGSAVIAAAFDRDPAVVLRRRQIFRLTFGMTLSSAIAFGYAWPLSFITPVFAAKLLVSPRALPPKAQAAVLALLWLGTTVGTEILLPIQQYPAVHLTFSALMLFLLFYAKAGGTNPLLIVFLLIGVVVVPLIGSVDPRLARAVADGLFFGAFVAIATVYVSGALFPDPKELPAPAKPPPPPPPPQGERVRLALRSLVVLYPLVALFQLYSAVNAAVALVFAMMLSMEPTYGAHLKAGAGLIVANLAGGVVAVALYQLLVFVPSFPFFLLLTTATGLLIGNQIMAGTTVGKLLSAGITTVFIVLGPTLTGDAAAASALVTRLFLIGVGVVYVVLAFGLLERLTRGTRRLQT